ATTRRGEADTPEKGAAGSRVVAPSGAKFMQDRRVSKGALLVGAAVISVAAWFALLPAQRPPSVVIPDRAADSSSAAMPVSLHPSPGQPAAPAGKVAPSATVLPVGDPVGGRLLEANDWRVFTEWAKQHPEVGGLYYASVAVNVCGDVRQQLKISQVPQAELA